MQPKMAEFFTEFLTDAGDLVMDPFAGSNTTGSIAERSARKWISIELDRSHTKASKARFEKSKKAPKLD